MTTIPFLPPLSAIVSLSMALIIGVAFPSRMRGAYKTKRPFIYRCAVAIAWIAYSAQASLLVGTPLRDVLIASEVGNSSYAWTVTIAHIPEFISSGLLALIAWRLICELGRVDERDQNSVQAKGRLVALAGRMRMVMLAIAPILAATMVLVGVPLLRWHITGLPLTEMEIYQVKPGKGIYVMNGKPLVARGAELEGKAAAGDVWVCVERQDSSAASYHTFRDVMNEPRQIWEVPLEGVVTIQIKARLMSGRFSGSYQMRLPYSRHIQVQLQFFRSTPRLVAYDITHEPRLLGVFVASVRR